MQFSLTAPVWLKLTMLAIIGGKELLLNSCMEAGGIGGTPGGIIGMKGMLKGIGPLNWPLDMSSCEFIMSLLWCV